MNVFSAPNSLHSQILSAPKAQSAPAKLHRALKNLPLSTTKIDFQDILKKAQFSLLKEKLNKKYDPKVVKKLFNQLEKLDRRSLSYNDQKNFTTWCHYLDIQAKYHQNLAAYAPYQQRLLKRLLRYTEKDLYQFFRHSNSLKTPTIEQIENCHTNIETFISYTQELHAEFDEDLCHRALTQVNLFNSDWLTGKVPYPPITELKKQISEYYKEEIEIRSVLSREPYSALKEQSKYLKKKIFALKDLRIAQELFLELALKIGKKEWIQAQFSKNIIEQQAKLFEASREGTNWAKQQTKLQSIEESEGISSLNKVYFLNKTPSESKESLPVAVFKQADEGAAKEALVYDIAELFGLQDVFAPTKLKKINEMSGSLQTYQNGISWHALCNSCLPERILPRKPGYFLPSKKTLWAMGHIKPHKNLPAADRLRYFAPNKVPKANWKYFEQFYLNRAGKAELAKAPSSQEITTQFYKELFKRVSIEDYFKAAIAALLFGNRDLHTGNFFLVPKENGQYKIVMFDNEMCFYPNNFIIQDSKGHSHLSVRNALLIFPHADVLIEGELKERLKAYVNSLPSSYQAFQKYLKSSKGKTILSKIESRSFDYEHIKAFSERLQTLIQLVNSDKEMSYRDIFYETFPLYSSFLSLAKLMQPVDTEIIVGYHSAEELCDFAIKMGYMTEEKKNEFIQQLQAYQ